MGVLRVDSLNCVVVFYVFVWLFWMVIWLFVVCGGFD